jgi:SAM-dependent methyltransferase
MSVQTNVRAGTPEAAEWRTLNRANWDERVGIHVRSKTYDRASLLEGRGELNAIEEAELGPVGGLRILHLQCHFGMDTLTLAQRGATVVGLDFSAPAIAEARTLAVELGLEDRARFVESDLYDAVTAIPEPQSFDLVYATWGTLWWLPDVRRWAEIVAHFLKPGGSLYLADGHPAAYVLDDAAPRQTDGTPGFFVPYFQREPLLLDDASDYADADARLANSKTCQWVHPLGEIVTSVIEAGLRLEWLHEHDAVPWRMFRILREDEGMFRWPEKPWLPLSFSLRASRPSPRG